MTNPVPKYEVSDTRLIDPSSIQALRESVGWEEDESSTWVEQLEKARAVRSVSFEGNLIGIGFLIGLRRHAIIADVCVNPSYQKRGIGHGIIASLVEAAQTSKYVTLTYDETRMDLPAFYAQHSFVPIDNAMQLRDANHQA